MVWDTRVGRRTPVYFSDMPVRLSGLHQPRFSLEVEGIMKPTEDVGGGLEDIFPILSFPYVLPSISEREVMTGR